MALLEQVFQFFGRVHPMVLHAPIGLLIGLVFIETLAILKRKPMPREVRAWLCWLAAASAVFSVITGLVLRREGGYGTTTVDLHQWLGISLGAVCLIAATLQQFGRVATYRVALTMAALVAVPVGHFGASLTHGESFLTDPFRPRTVETKPIPQVAAGEPLTQYAATIAPIIANRCIGCHGEQKDKGGLRLHTPEAIMQGGELGSVLVAFKPDESGIYRRLLLPLNDDEHMPPKSKPQPDASEIETLRAWIAAGASFTAPAVADVKDAAAKAPVAAGPSEADPAALAAIRAALVHVAPVSRGSTLLDVDFAAVAVTTDDERVARLLAPIKGQISELSLARAKISNASMKLIAGLPHLRRLDVSNTLIDDAGLAALAGNASIEELVIARTAVADIATIQAMPGLRHVYCWGTKLSTEAIATLRGNSKLTVQAGEAQPVAALEVEPPPVLAATNKAPPAPAAAAASLKPINTICPVSGKPIDPAKLVVYKGQVVGLCCEHCAEQFLADPEKFAGKLGK